MQTFLEETIGQLRVKYGDLSKLTLILPSKRAGGFLINYLRKSATSTTFAPIIKSIEDFIQEISGLSILDPIELLYKSYEAYVNTIEINKKESFESYASWATTLLSDFNEIDRYMVPQENFFSYLGSIKNLEHWYLQEKQTPLIKEYLNFWNSIFPLYKNLKTLLKSEATGFQGMVYREAANSIKEYSANKGSINHIFIGFNALNKAEEIILKELLETGNTELIWDAESIFYEDPQHSASMFMRKYSHEWNHYKEHPFYNLNSNYNQKKEFQLIEVQKNIGQAKFVGQLLSGYDEEALNKTAIVLADENLLIPIIESLPYNVQNVNITMGLPLQHLNSSVFFLNILKFHKTYTGTIYYKDAISILKHPIAVHIIPKADDIISNFTRTNATHLTLQHLLDLAPRESAVNLKMIFGDWGDRSHIAVSTCVKLLKNLINGFSQNQIQAAALSKIYSIFKEIGSLEEKYLHLKSIDMIYGLFQELLSVSTLNFEGDAYNGLQIMGVLESRALDFENVIITSVNEGILPSGKSNSSFINYELKSQFGLPLYTEKDAIYTYHFYHLLHRASKITLLHTNFSEGLNSGEKSRFLLQLEIDKPVYHTIEKRIVVPEINLEPANLKTIDKTPSVLKRIMEIAAKGFSPSSLTQYIRNPFDFYLKQILQLQQVDEIEETVAANTLGSIVHAALETLYKPFINRQMTEVGLKNSKLLVHETVTEKFTDQYGGGIFDKGKNLIIFEVAKRYIENFISMEIKEIQAGNSIEILALEKRLETSLEISHLPFPVKIKGYIDRVDHYNGQIRIIDYKTGKVSQNEMEIMDWTELTTDYKYHKIVQILAYSFLVRKEMNIEHCEAGIISFKNLSAGFIKFASKESARGAKNTVITNDILNEYLDELKRLINEICDPAIPFVEKEIEK